MYEGRGDDLKVQADGAVYETLRIPGLIYERAKDVPLSLQITFSLSVLSPQPAQTIAALGADQRLPHLGDLLRGQLGQPGDDPGDLGVDDVGGHAAQRDDGRRDAGLVTVSPRD